MDSITKGAGKPVAWRMKLGGNDRWTLIDEGEVATARAEGVTVEPLFSQPSAPTAADTGSGEGWVVKPEWRDAPFDKGAGAVLFLSGVEVGRAWYAGQRGFVAMTERGVIAGNPTATLAEAQAALLSAVRPKDGGAA